MTKHLSTERTLRYVDGELSKFATWQTTAHLKTCWACQAELDHLKDEIAAIVDAQTMVFTPSLPPPPGPWARLEPRLEQVRCRNVSLWTKLVPFAGQPLRLNLAYSGAALAVVLVALSLWVSPLPVSAKEVLSRLGAAEGKRLAVTERQVLRQRIRVARTSRVSSAKFARVESWQSLRSTYWDSGDPIGAELLKHYESYGLGSALPMSLAAVETWVKVAGDEPDARRGWNGITVAVAAGAASRARGLERVSFHVNTANWCLDELTLAFADATYQITEQDSSVIPREEVPLAVLARLEPLAPAPSRVAAAPAVPDAGGVPIDMDDLEMGVRYDLHQMGADLGEAIEIAPQASGVLRVEARQVSPDIKEKLIALLGRRGSVQLEFQVRGTGAPGRDATRTIPQTRGLIAPADPRVASFFGSAQAQETYTQSVLETSNTVLAHLHALQELAGRWPEDRERALSSGSRTSLDAMVRDHIRQVTAQTAELQKQLAPLMQHFEIPLAGSAPPRLAVSWQEASVSCLDTGRRVDRLLRSLLTASDSTLAPEEALPILRQDLRALERNTPQQ
jgi:hypothetical protein